MKIEICVQSYEEAQKALLFDINRLELNSCLHLGGLTPSMGSFLRVKELAHQHAVPVICMVRNSAGGFVYLQEEVDTMMLDAQLLLENGADGIVFGFLEKDLCLAEKPTRKMIELCHSNQKEAVFHRAFDLLKQPLRSLECLVKWGIDRVLTSGQEAVAMDGIKSLQSLIELAPSKIIVGSGVNHQNAVELIQQTGCLEIHTSARCTVDDPQPPGKVNYRYLENNQLDTLSEELVDKLVEKIRRL